MAELKAKRVGARNDTHRHARPISSRRLTQRSLAFQTKQGSAIYRLVVSSPFGRITTADRLEWGRVSDDLKRLSAPQMKRLRSIAAILNQAIAVSEMAPNEPAWEELADEAHERRRRVIEAQEVVPSGRLIQALGITRQALSKAVLARRLFSVEFEGENYYPAFFADPTLERRSLERANKVLGPLNGWEKYIFYMTPKHSLQRLTPIQALRRGNVEAVVHAAHIFLNR